MKYLLISWLLIRATAAQAPFFDVPIINENSVGQARIGMRFSELRRIYAGCAFSPAYLSSYGFDEWPAAPDAVIVSQGSQKLFLYYDTYDIIKNKQVRTRRVTGLIALHSAYRTKQGIHVGSSSGTLRTALPAIKTAPNIIAGVDVQDAQVVNSHISYSFLNQRDVGPQRKNHYGEEVPLTVKTGWVSWIGVGSR